MIRQPELDFLLLVLWQTQPTTRRDSERLRVVGQAGQGRSRDDEDLRVESERTNDFDCIIRCRAIRPIEIPEMLPRRIPRAERVALRDDDDDTESRHRSQRHDERFQVGHVEQNVMTYDHIARLDGTTGQFRIPNDIGEPPLYLGMDNADFLSSSSEASEHRGIFVDCHDRRGAGNERYRRPTSSASDIEDTPAGCGKHLTRKFVYRIA